MTGSDISWSVKEIARVCRKFGGSNKICVDLD